MSEVAVITGGSSGIGRAAAERFVRAGWKVYELSRREAGQPGIHLHCDLCDPDSVRAAFEVITGRERKIDLLINNAGSGISGAVEFTDLQKARQLFDLNFFGTFLCVRHALPLLRAAKGRILNLSSVAAELPIPFQAFYSASKAAVNALTLCLRNELKPFGVTVCALLPGDISTGFTAARDKEEAGDDLYGGRIRRSVETMERDEQHGMSPDFIAGRLYRLAQKRRVRPLYGAGASYRLFLVLAKLLPRSLSNWAVGKLY